MKAKRLTQKEQMEIFIMNMGKKRCNVCLEYKEKDAFAKNGKNLRKTCKECTNAERRADYKFKKGI